MRIRKSRSVSDMKRRQQQQKQQQQQRQPGIKETAGSPSQQQAAVKRPKPSPIEFGPYLSDRQWGTIREDLSADGSCWEFCDFRRSHRDPYLTGEDGLLGICDPGCRICFAWGFWNGRDPFVKEKLFGLTGGAGAQGNHGEDVKEAYFYQVSTPDHGYMRAKYMYPSGTEFPYEALIRGNAARTASDDEMEIYDTDAFKQGFWEITVEYAKVPPAGSGASETGDELDTVCLMTAKNCSDCDRTLHAMPTVWFRNTWSTVYASEPQATESKTSSIHRPVIIRVSGHAGAVECRHPSLPSCLVRFNADPSSVAGSEILFTRNETGEKDAISRYLVETKPEARPALPHGLGTKCSSVHLITAGPGESKQVAVRISSSSQTATAAHAATASVSVPVAEQRARAEKFYADLLSWLPSGQTELAEICRLAYSGLLWSKQYYEYRVAGHQRMRQSRSQKAAAAAAFKWNPNGWDHLDNADVMSMPDKWEFPWYASWDSSFHAAVLVDVDPEFAKGQIELLLSDRFMSPEGQVPGCEFNYSDENPPVVAWAAHEVWRATGDAEFARRVCPRLKLNFNWWLAHRRVKPDAPGGDDDGVYFKSGFLGMDNICAFDRSQVPKGCRVYQADAYAWVFCTALNCLQLALAARQSDSEVAFWLDRLAELQRGFRHLDADGDGFCYDILERRRADGTWERQFVLIKSMVGLMPLTAVMPFDWDLLGRRHAAALERSGLRVERSRDRRTVMVSLLDGEQWARLFGHLFPESAAGADDGEGFLGPYGVRMVSRWHGSHPVTLNLNGTDWTLNYEPGESRTRMYGGNSNWRGPVWLCMNFLLAQAALRMHSSGVRRRPELRQFARLVCQRVLAIFTLQGKEGRRPVHGDCWAFSDREGGPWSGTEYVLLYEYFHGDTGRGCGASHQTGWTAMVAKFAEMLHTELMAD